MLNSRCASSLSLAIGLARSITAEGKGWRGGAAHVHSGPVAQGKAAYDSGRYDGFKYVFFHKREG